MTTAIETLLQKFAEADASMITLLAEDIDFRIDHYKDEADVSWQAGKGLAALGEILQRLAMEVFPKGTKALRIETTALDQEGWHLTRFEQEFFYGLGGFPCRSSTYILSHEADGKVDFFRETVTEIIDLSQATH